MLSQSNSETDPLLRSANGKLQGILNVSLVEAKIGCCRTAIGEIRRARDGRERGSIFARYSHLWAEKNVQLIRDYVPRFADIAGLYCTNDRNERFEWIKENIWRCIQEKCSIRNSLPDKQMQYIAEAFAIFSDGYIPIEIPPARLWKRVLDQNTETETVWGMLDRVIDEALRLLELREAISVPPKDASNLIGKNVTRKTLINPILAEKGWSINDWAREAGVDVHTVDNYLNGKTRNPYPHTLKKMADPLGLTATDLSIQ